MKLQAYHQRARNRFTNYLSRLPRPPAPFCVRRNGLDDRRSRLYIRRGRFFFSGMDIAFAETNSTLAGAVSTRECVRSTRAETNSTGEGNVY